MPYTATIKPPVMFVSWQGATGGDLRAVTERLAEMRRTSGRPVAYLARIPAEHHVFTDEDKKVLLAFLNGILPSCSAIHHIIEGDGFLKSARLAFVASLATATARPRDFHVHGTVEEGLRAMMTTYGVDLRTPAASVATALESAPERASAVFRGAARIADAGRAPPRKGS